MTYFVTGSLLRKDKSVYSFYLVPSYITTNLTFLQDFFTFCNYFQDSFLVLQMVIFLKRNRALPLKTDKNEQANIKGTNSAF